MTVGPLLLSSGNEVFIDDATVRIASPTGDVLARVDHSDITGVRQTSDGISIVRRNGEALTLAAAPGIAAMMVSEINRFVVQRNDPSDGTRSDLGTRGAGFSGRPAWQRWGLFGCGGLLGLCILLAVIGLIANALDTDGAGETSSVEADRTREAPTATKQVEATSTATVTSATATIQAGVSVTSPPAPTATMVPPTNTAAPSGADVQSDQIIVMPGAGGARFMGQVVNRGGGPASHVRVVVTVYDAAGAVLASSGNGTLMMRPVIPAGEVGPYAGILSSFDPALIAETKVEVEFDDYDSSDFVYLSEESIEVVQAQWGEDKLTGEVRNIGEGPIGSAYVLAVAYGADGVIVNVQLAHVTSTEIAPGEVAAFDQTIFGDDPAPATFALFPYAVAK